MSDLKAQIVEIVRDVAKLDRSKPVNSQASLKDLGVDSLEVANVFLNIAERFNIDIPDQEIDRLTTIDMITEYLATRVAKV